MGLHHTGAISRAGLSQYVMLRLSGSLLCSPPINKPRPADIRQTKALAARHVRRFCSPAQRWNEVRRHASSIFRTTTTINNGRPSAVPLTVVFCRRISSAIPKPTPYSALTLGIPRETFPNERRVSITPQNVALLLKKGFGRVFVEHGAGVNAKFTDEAYEHAGATLVDRKRVWSESDILLKVRAP